MSATKTLTHQKNIRMLFPLKINKTKLVPEVILDKENNIFKISGKSITVNAVEFYSQILTWFKEYLINPNENAELVLQFDYINSSSSIQLNRVLSLLEKNKNNDNQIKVIWLYEEDDELICEMGKELQNSSKLNFELREFEDLD